jgi:putative membrane protein
MPHSHHAVFHSSRSSVILTMILVFTALIYLRGWLSLRFSHAGSRRVAHTSAWHVVSFLVGLFLIWIALASPIAGLDHELLTVHMLQHLLLMTLAPPLIWLALPVRPVLRGLPQRFLENIFAQLLHSRAAERVAEAMERPIFAWLAACAALVGWHIPRLFALGMQSDSWHLFEQLSFLTTGLMFWWPVIQAFVQPSTGDSSQDLSMILYLFFATLPCDILSGFLAFSDRVVYPMYLSSSHLWGFSPLVDQQCAAALMWTCVTMIYFAVGAILTMRLLSSQGRSQIGLVQPRLATTGIIRRVSQSLSVGH